MDLDKNNIEELYAKKITKALGGKNPDVSHDISERLKMARMNAMKEVNKKQIVTSSNGATLSLNFVDYKKYIVLLLTFILLALTFQVFSLDDDDDNDFNDYITNSFDSGSNHDQAAINFVQDN